MSATFVIFSDDAALVISTMSIDTLTGKVTQTYNGKPIFPLLQTKNVEKEHWELNGGQTR